MLLSQIDLRYFRSLYEVALLFKPLTILIGPNASGKSNLFKALRFLHDAMAGDRLDWQAYDSQVDELRWYGYDEYGIRPDILNFDLFFATASSEPPVARYSTSLRCDDYLKIDTEKLHLRLSESDERLTPFFERHLEDIRQYIGPKGRKRNKPSSAQARSARTLTLRDDGPSLRVLLAKAVYDHIAGWRFVDVDPYKARQEAFIPEYPEEVPPLEGDTGNLSAFLYALWRRLPDDFDTINQALSEFIDLPQKILVEHDAERGGRHARYRFIERPYGENRLLPPESMSDGTIRLLAHLALLLGDRSVRLACLEEPDHGLHPRLMLYLADLLRQAVTNVEDVQNHSPLQIIVTTHSPEFMDCFDLDAEQDYLQVYIAERDEVGKTLFVPTTAQEFAPWLKRYRLGEAVRRRFV